MVQSILDDIKGQFRYGNMISKIILVNLFVFLVVILVKAFTPGGGSSPAFQNFLSYLALSSESIELLKRPWTIFTHMILHEGIWHIFWNMILLFWFGKIVGDLLGDHRILPVYVLGGLSGALFYLIYAAMSGGISIAYGASAAVMAFVVASGFVAPEYQMRLILLGEVRLKYIAFALVLIDLIMISEANNTGGRIAHLGGAIFGGGFIYFLRQGKDISAPFVHIMDRIRSGRSSPQADMTVVHKKKDANRPKSQILEERVDEILDKINESGYESLTDEEKEVLYQASKK